MEARLSATLAHPRKTSDSLLFRRLRRLRPGKVHRRRLLRLHPGRRRRLL